MSVCKEMDLLERKRAYMTPVKRSSIEVIRRTLNEDVRVQTSQRNFRVSERTPSTKRQPTHPQKGTREREKPTN